jgi:hypothetical protein
MLRFSDETGMCRVNIITRNITDGAIDERAAKRDCRDTQDIREAQRRQTE